MQSSSLEDIQRYANCLDVNGPAGLDFLNARVPHRFTGVYRLQRGVLVNLFLHDKCGEVIPEYLKAVRLEDSFCQFVLRDGFFMTLNSAADRRLDGHAYQGAVGSYYGVPLLDNGAQLYGTLCHFDMMSYPISDDEFEFLQQAAKVLPKYLHRTESLVT